MKKQLEEALAQLEALQAEFLEFKIDIAQAIGGTIPTDSASVLNAVGGLVEMYNEAISDRDAAQDEAANFTDRINELESKYEEENIPAYKNLLRALGIADHDWAVLQHHMNPIETFKKWGAL